MTRILSASWNAASFEAYLSDEEKGRENADQERWKTKKGLTEVELTVSIGLILAEDVGALQDGPITTEPYLDNVVQRFTYAVESVGCCRATLYHLCMSPSTHTCF